MADHAVVLAVHGFLQCGEALRARTGFLRRLIKHTSWTFLDAPFHLHRVPPTHVQLIPDVKLKECYESLYDRDYTMDLVRRGIIHTTQLVQKPKADVEPTPKLPAFNDDAPPYECVFPIETDEGDKSPRSLGWYLRDPHLAEEGCATDPEMCLPGYTDSVNYLFGHLLSMEEPFPNVLFGFSQGATILAGLYSLCERVLTSGVESPDVGGRIYTTFMDRVKRMFSAKYILVSPYWPFSTSAKQPEAEETSIVSGIAELPRPPVLIMFGETDAVIPRGAIDAISAKSGPFHGACTVVTHGGGHYIPGRPEQKPVWKEWISP